MHLQPCSQQNINYESSILLKYLFIQQILQKGKHVVTGQWW